MLLQAVTLFSSATLAKQRLQMFRGGLRSLLAGEFGALRAQGEARRAAAARQLAEDQAREKVRPKGEHGTKQDRVCKCLWAHESHVGACGLHLS